ncbi:MAG: MCE family protein [Deltaproteobacteria bacterium]|nr:MCE family protein [Deltaproteobacteria bacterium]MBW1922998.1 MCE family protein [Deltaproteobacteria bacterium]MBW1951098.1 MCE family protein [Deltaproteobacteria bacterium]MBW2009623.1 MCE family protein [Deltaproteobacteria bacterium]MBW2101935.1 MCE family protein [Deltaproteobacteria bacterium]
MNRRKENLELKVGVFVLLVLASALFLVFYAAVRQDLFSRRVSYLLMCETGEQIQPGIPVKLTGIKIGQVSAVALDPSGKARIEIQILEKYRKWLTRGSRTFLSREGVIGSAFVKLIPGGRGSKLLPEGAKIPLERVGGVEEEVRRILKEAAPVMDDLRVTVANIRKITDQFVDPRGPIQRLLLNTDRISRMLASRDGLLEYVSGDPDAVRSLRRIMERADHIGQSLDRLLENANTKVEEVLPPVQQEIMVVLKEARALVAEFSRVKEQLNPAIENVLKITQNIRDATVDLERIRREGEYTLRLSTELLQRLQSTWPLGPEKETRVPLEHPMP